jgi:transposase
MVIRGCWPRRPVPWTGKRRVTGRSQPKVPAGAASWNGWRRVFATLADRPRPGRQPRLAEAQRSELAKWVEDGPDRKTDGVVRWRCADLRDRIAAKFNVHLQERSVGKLLNKLNFSSMSVRPLHPQSDLAAQEAFKKTSPSWRAPQSRRSLPAGRSKSGFRMKPVLESQGTLTRIWAKRGTRPCIKRDRRFTWDYRFGAICPARGTGAALVMPTVSIDAMNKHLVEISKCVSVSAIALMILDGAGWHGSPRLVVLDNIVLLPLPPYAPDLNPMDPSAEAMRRAARLWHHRRFMQLMELPHEPLLMI